MAGRTSDRDQKNLLLLSGQFLFNDRVVMSHTHPLTTTSFDLAGYRISKSL